MSEVLKQHRLPRFKRVKENIPNIILQQRDIDILKLVYDFRFINSEQIHLLIKGSEQGLLKRLQKLFHQGFVDRPPQQLVNQFLTGERKIIYALGRKGAETLNYFGLIEKEKIDWTAKNWEARDTYLNHSMMIANFRTSLTLALREIKDTRITTWLSGMANELRTQTKDKIPVSPDAFFTIEDEKSRLHFFLEADQSTMINKRFLQKMKGYWYYWKEQGCYNKYKIKNFRVLTITKSKERMENLKRITRNADEKKQGSTLFWFTCEKNYSLKEPSNILKPIWETAKEDGLHSLLE
ncbi:MAG: replication-relaxation family protein [bacterium]